tara:strand:- start:4546 stop:5400 length:855 start_codon:yes stop_codon:yes gene_type:complete
MKIIKYFIQSFFIYLFFIIAKIFGIKLSRKVFSFLFLNLAHFFKSKYVVEKNLNIFNKNLTKIEKKRIVSNMWKNYGMTFIEYIFLKDLKKNNSHIYIEGRDKLNKILQRGKPVIFVSGHFANFELMSMEIIKSGIKLATIYRPLNNFFLNPFMERVRKKYVCPNQIKKGINGVRESIEFIKEGFSIALMIDQRVSEGEKIPFFNSPALTTTLPAQLAKKYNLPIIPVFIERKDLSKFYINFYEEIDPSNFKDKNELTIKLNKILEQMIIKNPDQWIWTHNRWK